MFVESLERRAMLSVSVAGGVLTVTGTGGNDHISIRAATDDAGKAILVVTEDVRGDDAKAVVTRVTEAVTSVVVNAGAGNDGVSLVGKRRTPFNVAAEINGGDGNDRLSGGAAADRINGGAGDDRADGNGGNDVINGEAGEDRLGGGAGNDTVSGGADDDRLDGGAGDDSLSGGDGNDRLNAADRGGKDAVDGGAPVATTTPTTTETTKKGRRRGPTLITDGDVATVDSADTVTNVEQTITVKDKGGKGRR